MLSPEFMTRMQTVITRGHKLTEQTHDWKTYTLEQQEAARAELLAMRDELEAYSIVEELINKVGPAGSFVAAYNLLKPEAVNIVSEVIDEILDLMVVVTAGLKNRSEFLASVAESTYDLYLAYRTAGFSEEQAFALTAKVSNDIQSAVQKSLQDSISKIDIKRS